MIVMLIMVQLLSGWGIENEDTIHAAAHDFDC